MATLSANGRLHEGATLSSNGRLHEGAIFKIGNEKITIDEELDISNIISKIYYCYNNFIGDEVKLLYYLLDNNYISINDKDNNVLLNVALYSKNTEFYYYLKNNNCVFTYQDFNIAINNHNFLNINITVLLDVIENIKTFQELSLAPIFMVIANLDLYKMLLNKKYKFNEYDLVKIFNIWHNHHKNKDVIILFMENEITFSPNVVNKIIQINANDIEFIKEVIDYSKFDIRPYALQLLKENLNKKDLVTYLLDYIDLNNLDKNETFNEYQCMINAGLSDSDIIKLLLNIHKPIIPNRYWLEKENASDSD